MVVTLSIYRLMTLPSYYYANMAVFVPIYLDGCQEYVPMKLKRTT